MPLSTYLKSGGVVAFFLLIAGIVGAVSIWLLTIVLNPIIDVSNIWYFAILLIGLEFTIILIILGFLVHKKKEWL